MFAWRGFLGYHGKCPAAPDAEIDLLVTMPSASFRNLGERSDQGAKRDGQECAVANASADACATLMYGRWFCENHAYSFMMVDR